MGTARSWHRAAAALAAAAVVGGLPLEAAAYVGPGAGLSLLGSLLWLLVAVLTAIGIVLYWPVRVLLRWIRLRWAEPAPPAAEDAPPAEPPEEAS